MTTKRKPATKRATPRRRPPKPPRVPTLPDAPRSPEEQQQLARLSRLAQQIEADATAPDDPAEKSQDVAQLAVWARVAAELRWSDPSATWTQIAEACGRSRRQLERVRKTEEWDRMFREVGDRYLDRLAPAAMTALVRQWAKGNANGAVEVLRSFGFLRDERLRVGVEDEIPEDDLDRIIAELLSLAKPVRA